MNTYHFSLAILLSAFIFSCNSPTHKQESKQEFKLVNVNDKFSIKIPKYMSKAEDLNEDAVVQYQNIYKETYAIVIEEPSQEFIDIFQLLGEYNDSLSMLDNYTTVQLKYLDESVKVTNTIGPTSIKIDTLDANLVEITAKLEDLDLYYQMLWIDGGEDVYGITVWTFLNRKEKYKSTFDTMLRSFKLIESKPATNE